MFQGEHTFDLMALSSGVGILYVGHLNANLRITLGFHSIQGIKARQAVAIQLSSSLMPSRR